MDHYDYIILGAGAAGLMLARGMTEDPWFDQKKILLIDKDAKAQNDRTWCFWEKEDGPFNEILSQRWNTIRFKSAGVDKEIPIEPYSYKMVRARDFYEDQFRTLRPASNIEFLQEEVIQIEENDEYVTIKTTNNSVKSSQVFNSIFDINVILSQRKYPVLQQHFIGWFIEAPNAEFDPETATFMDFSIPQKGNTRFMYVLPFSTQKALVEYTLFSGSLLEESEYEAAIEDYIQNDLGISEYRVLEKETGRIPMTCYDFEKHNSRRILHIGTAGGWAKPSTGYTFSNSYRYSKQLIEHLKNNRPLLDFSVKSRYWYYDLLLLDILDRNNVLGSEIFESMFKKRSPQLIFKFLGEQANLMQDLFLITACPTRPFIKALWRRIWVNDNNGD